MKSSFKTFGAIALLSVMTFAQANATHHNKHKAKHEKAESAKTEMKNEKTEIQHRAQ